MLHMAKRKTPFSFVAPVLAGNMQHVSSSERLAVGLFSNAQVVHGSRPTHRIRDANVGSARKTVLGRMWHPVRPTACSTTRTKVSDSNIRSSARRTE
jgi:hypothetical protein